ncbi:NAD(P)/FAD-dependent oxidoreductase [Thermodesulfobacteriota bacterium]
MFDWDVVIVGGGPAGITAGLYLSRARYRVLLLEKDGFGGPIRNVELIENYPGFPEGVSGAELASGMVIQATDCGLQLELGEVVDIEIFSNCKYVTCADGKGYTAAVVIVAGGAKPKKLGVPGEDTFMDKGIIHCALCDGGQFVDRVIAVCGGGDAGISEALYMAKLASKVIILEAEPALTATPILQERAVANPKLDIRCGVKVEEIIGDEQVQAIALGEVSSGRRYNLDTDGLLIYIGVEPNTSYLDGIISLDDNGQVIVNDHWMETDIPFILAAGDIRSGSPMQVVTAVGDGATAAISAQRLLRTLE